MKLTEKEGTDSVSRWHHVILSASPRFGTLLLCLSTCLLLGITVSVWIAFLGMPQRGYRGALDVEMNCPTPQFLSKWSEYGLLEPNGECVWTQKHRRALVDDEWGGILRLSQGRAFKPNDDSDVQIVSRIGDAIGVQPIEGSALFLQRTGWPLRCFEGGFYFDGSGIGNHHRDILTKYETLSLSRVKHVDMTFDNWWSDADVMGMRPIIIPLLLNGLFYAIVPVLGFLLFIIARADDRLAENKCARCGYNLAQVDHERCPECGMDAWNRSEGQA